MPAKNFLNSETKEKLQRALKDHEHPDIRERVLIFFCTIPDYRGDTASGRSIRPITIGFPKVSWQGG